MAVSDYFGKSGQRFDSEGIRAFGVRHNQSAYSRRRHRNSEARNRNQNPFAHFVYAGRTAECIDQGGDTVHAGFPSIQHIQVIGNRPPRGHRTRPREVTPMNAGRESLSLAEQVRQFQESFQNILLASVSVDGRANASTAPCLLLNGCFHILVSELAQHTNNLLRHPQCHVLFVQDERESTNLFARKRLGLDCQASPISRDEPRWDEIVSEFRQRFGSVAAMVSSLPDFVLFELRPTSGSFVRGFAQATAIDPSIFQSPA